MVKWTCFTAGSLIVSQTATKWLVKARSGGPLTVDQWTEQPRKQVHLPFENRLRRGVCSSPPPPITGQIPLFKNAFRKLEEWSSRHLASSLCSLMSSLCCTNFSWGQLDLILLKLPCSESFSTQKVSTKWPTKIIHFKEILTDKSDGKKLFHFPFLSIRERSALLKREVCTK